MTTALATATPALHMNQAVPAQETPALSNRMSTLIHEIAPAIGTMAGSSVAKLETLAVAAHALLAEAEGTIGYTGTLRDALDVIVNGPAASDAALELRAMATEQHGHGGTRLKEHLDALPLNKEQKADILSMSPTLSGLTLLPEPPSLARSLRMKGGQMPVLAAK